MQNFDVAHIKVQGKDLIIVVVDGAFGGWSPTQQGEATDSLQLCAESAGLAGTVVPVWRDVLNRLNFYAPQAWQTFFASIDMDYVAGNINLQLTCQF